MIINVQSPKGGAGCSTFAVILASRLAREGQVTLVGNDQSIPSILGIHEQSNGWTQDLQAGVLDPSTLPPSLMNDHVTGIPNLAVYAQGIPDPEWQVRDLLPYLSGPGPEYGTLVVDIGTHRPTAFADRTVNVLVNDYLSLREMMRRGPNMSAATVLYTRPGSALTKNDVASVLEPNCGAFIMANWDMQVARAVDAGILHIRDPRTVVNAATETIEALGLKVGVQ